MNNKFEYAVDSEIIKKMKCKTIELPIYTCSVNFIFGDDAIKLEKSWGKRTSGFGGLTRNFLKDNGTVLISFPDKKPKLEYVVHELHHAVDMIINDIGHKKDPEGDEPSAYLIGYLISEYLKIKKNK